MREKYVEERFPRYYIFGTYKNGRVDVSDGKQDVAVSVTVEFADEMIAKRNIVVDMLVKLALELDRADPIAFQRIWYAK